MRGLALVVLAACGDATARLDVAIQVSSMPELDPYPLTNLTQVRVRVDGPEAYDDIAQDLGRDRRTATFEGLSAETTVSVVVEGYDRLGNVLAFGRTDGVLLEGDVQVNVELRRNLAYAIHRPNSEFEAPESKIYLIDMAARAYAGQLRIPGQAPVALGVSARGGRAMLVTYRDGGRGRLGILSANDHSWSSIELPRIHELALGSPASPLGVAAGSGGVSIIDLDQGQVVQELGGDFGGRVVDGAIAANGQHALFVLDVDPGVLYVDLNRRTVRALDVIPGAAGVAVSSDGLVAYVTSRQNGGVVAFELANARATPLGAFVRPVQLATYSEPMKGVLGLDVQSNGAGRVLGFVVPAAEPLRYEEGTATLRFPIALASDGSGRRAVVVATGDAPATAGLTIVETFPAAIPEGSSGYYPTDPLDTVTTGGVTVFRRYQPLGVAVIYGR